jgi:hypothetical protein
LASRLKNAETKAEILSIFILVLNEFRKDCESAALDLNIQKLKSEKIPTLVAKHRNNKVLVVGNTTKVGLVATFCRFQSQFCGLWNVDYD